MKLKFLILLVILSALLSSCSFSLAADVTPPPGYQQPVVEVPVEATIGPLYPLVPPDPAKGESIYAEKCAPCHGEAGLGNGPRAAQLPNPVPAIGTAEVARQAVPAEWFSIVTQGNLERFMPPFQSLTDQQRWDVVAYSLSLSAPNENVVLGRQLYQANCVECHGEGGEGDGPSASDISTQLPDFTNQEYMASKSGEDFIQAISQGVAPAMPAFAGQLSDQELGALINYLRWFTFAPKVAQATPGASQSAPVAQLTPGAIITMTTSLTTTAPLNDVGGLGLISGIVMNASGGEVPVGLEINLHSFEGMQLAESLTTTLKADGTYAFEGVEMPEGRSFLATVNYNGAIYGSEVVEVEPDQNTLQLPIQVYATTTDASGLTVDRLHYFFEFLDEQTLRVVELYIISNPGEYTVVASGESQPVLNFTLPAEATNLEFEDGRLGERFVQTPDGFGDTLPVRPGIGGHQVVFSYEMPYSRKLELARPVNLPTNAVVVLVPEENVKVRSDALQDMGTRDVQGMLYRMYNGGSLSPGEELSLTITGRPSSQNPTLSASSTTGLLIGGAALGLVLIVAGVWLYRRNQLSEVEVEAPLGQGIQAPAENAETIMDAILALDDLYQEGQLPEEAYLKRRAELKDRLREVMGKSDA